MLLRREVEKKERSREYKMRRKKLKKKTNNRIFENFHKHILDEHSGKSYRLARCVCPNIQHITKERSSVSQLICVPYKIQHLFIFVHFRRSRSKCAIPLPPTQQILFIWNGVKMCSRIKMISSPWYTHANWITRTSLYHTYKYIDGFLTSRLNHFLEWNDSNVFFEKKKIEILRRQHDMIVSANFHSEFNEKRGIYATEYGWDVANVLNAFQRWIQVFFLFQSVHLVWSETSICDLNVPSMWIQYYRNS